MPYKSRDNRLKYMARRYRSIAPKVRLYGKEYGRAYRESLRADMITAYGGSCVFCGENDAMVLVLDHINDDGKLDTKSNGKRCVGVPLYARLKKLNWPRDRYQLLCANCNMRKECLRRQRDRE